MEIQNFEKLFKDKVASIASTDDPAHDLLHFQRVVNTAKKLCLVEKAKMEVVLPAAWLHDLVIVPKNDQRRKQASKLSAEAALIFLKDISYPSQYFAEIAHAIEAHSFSANIQTQSLEAMIVQDADRLDALGAIGIARCFSVSALMKHSFYSEVDPFCTQRAPDDKNLTIDHFYTKLFKLVETMKTVSAKAEGERRIRFMKSFLSQLGEEIATTS